MQVQRRVIPNMCEYAKHRKGPRVNIKSGVGKQRDVGLLWSEANDKGKFPDCLRTGGLGRWSVE